jgi:hypothetical protein
VSATLVSNAITYTRGRIEGDRLTRALLDGAAAGLRPRCGDYETAYLFLSEDAGEREQAIRLCAGQHSWRHAFWNHYRGPRTQAERQILSRAIRSPQSCVPV